MTDWKMTDWNLADCSGNDAVNEKVILVYHTIK